MVLVLQRPREVSARVYGQEVTCGAGGGDDACARRIGEGLLPNSKVGLVTFGVGTLLRTEVGVKRINTGTATCQLAARGDAGRVFHDMWWMQGATNLWNASSWSSIKWTSSLISSSGVETTAGVDAVVLDLLYPPKSRLSMLFVSEGRAGAPLSLTSSPSPRFRLRQCVVCMCISEQNTLQYPDFQL